MAWQKLNALVRKQQCLVSWRILNSPQAIENQHTLPLNRVGIISDRNSSVRNRTEEASQPGAAQSDLSHSDHKNNFQGG
jgi:hypothetical protein